MSDLERGNIEVGVKADTLTPIINDVKLLVNRLVLGIIAAAFVIGVAILLVVYHPVVGLWWVGVLFFIGFTFAFALGVYLALAIIRSRKKRQ